MELVQIDAADREAVRELVGVAGAAREVDAPWMPPSDVDETQGHLLHGWDLEPRVPFLASAGGEPVGWAEYETSEYDNRHVAWLRFDVHPDRRRRGYGSAIWAELLDRARAEGRTSVGTHGWDGPAATGFATAHSLACRSREVCRRQLLAEVDRAAVQRLHAEAAAGAAAYELVRLEGPVPEAELEDLAVMAAAINDAPLDDLDLEDEVITPGRIRAYEEAQRLRGIRIRRLYARHRATGALAGQTVVGVDSRHPDRSEQHDTSVVRAHRGHRLGLLLKLEMLGWLHEVEPQLRSIDTFNAESNDHMIAVNEALGYRALGRVLFFQRAL